MENTNQPEQDFKKARIDDAVRRNRRQKMLWIAGMAALIAVLVGSSIAYNRWAKRDLPGQTIADQGREHVGPDHVHSYNSNPPTSGWHFPAAAEWGVYKEELPDETLIHNLEHGGIWISYKPDIPEETRKKLENFYELYGRKVIVTPRAKNDTDIALAAWTRLDKFSVPEYSEERVDKFIKAFRNRGPEFVP